MHATWIFMRHFQKEPHPRTFTKEEVAEAAQSGVYADQLVEKWDQLDREVVGLSLEGYRQALATCTNLPGYLRKLDTKLERIFVSPYKRTEKSAELLHMYGVNGMPIIPDERLIELKNGVRNLAAFEEVCKLWPEYGKAAHSAFLEAAPPFGESHAQARDGRVRSFINDLKKRSGGTLVITHAGVIECVHQIVYGTPDEDVVQKFAEERSARFGSVLVCEYDRKADRITPIIDDHCLYELP
jgi:broad specificity phosphatase PhoE